MEREKKKIKVCDCGAPLIWTFFIPYAEYYCLNCGNAGGMFGTGRDVEFTKERKLQKLIVDAVFKVIRKKKLPLGTFGRSGCKKDNKDGRCASYCDNHRAHLTKTEIEWDKIATKYLKHFNKKKLLPTLTN